MRFLQTLLWTLASTFVVAQQQERTQPKADSAGVYFVGPEIAAPTLVRAVPALLPIGAADAKVQGFSVWTMVLHKDRTVSDIKLFQPLGTAFDTSAIKAINKCEFEPARLLGVPVDVHIGLAVPFRIKDQAPVPRIAVIERDTNPQAVLLGSGNRHDSGANDIGPLLIHRAEAVYADPTIRARFQGVVTLSTTVDADGVPKDVKLIRPLGLGLDQRAIDAVRSYRYRPATNNGQPVAQAITLEVNCLLY